MIKRIWAIILTCILLILSSSTVFAGTDVDIGGGGSDDMGGGTNQNKWNAGRDGIRVTVVDARSGSTVKQPIDLTNRTGLSNYFHFGKASKIEYMNGRGLSPSAGNYKYLNPATPLPNIIHCEAAPANIDTTRRFFSTEVTIRYIAQLVNMDFDTLTNGSYKLLLEPLVYLTYQGNLFAMTAQECAMYDELVAGDIWRKFTDVSHKNLPLALFLERGGLGIPAWTGTTTGRVTNAQIKQALGVGIVSFGEDEENPDPVPENPQPDYSGGLTNIGGDKYRVDTDVITSFWITGGSGGVSPDDAATATVTINGTDYRQNYVVPPGDTTLIWVKWHTPTTPGRVTIDASCTDGSIQDSHRNIQVVSLDLEEPPNPEGTDLRDGWTMVAPPSYPNVTSKTWSEWSPWWEEKWEWESNWQWVSGSHTASCPSGCTSSHGTWVDYGQYVDNGEWKYDQIFYSASLTASQALSTYSKTAYTKYGVTTLKSGYGVYGNVSTQVTCNDTISNYTPVQTVISAFPEFQYKKYYRLLEPSFSGGNADFHFYSNPFSQFNDYLHFSPIWYPDNEDYPVQVVAIDAWTPGGMLSYTGVTDNMKINGNLYDDWYITRTK